MYVVNQNIQAKYICISSTEKQWTKLSRRVQYDYSRSRVTVDLTVDAPREQQQLGRSVKCLSSAAGFSIPSLPLPPATVSCATPVRLKGNGKDCHAG